MLKLKKAKLKPTSIIRLLPNLITLSALVVGMNSIRFALDGKWDYAASCIIISAFLDALDGRVARMIGATSVFGAELDSLTDFANFGVAPALISYLWAYQRFEFKLFSWAAILLLVICMAIRLARFNVGASSKEDQKVGKNFFVGIPAPMGAMLFIIPIIIDFEISANFRFDVRSHIFFVTCYQIVIALLVASRIPTFSLKNIEVKPEYIWVCLLAFAAFIIAMLAYPWYLLPILACLYLVSIALSVKAKLK